MVLSNPPKRIPRRGLDPSACRPRTPTGVARRSGHLPPLRSLRLAVQRHQSPQPGRVGTTISAALAVQGLPGQRLAPAAPRDHPAAAADLPGAGGRPVRALRQFPGPRPAAHRGPAHPETSSFDEDDLTHLDRVLQPILQRLARQRLPEAGPVLLAYSPELNDIERTFRTVKHGAMPSAPSPPPRP